MTALTEQGFKVPGDATEPPTEGETATAKEKLVENEKYAFHCVLLSLGFIGDEHKVDRKILLSRSDRNSAWKGGRPE